MKLQKFSGCFYYHSKFAVIIVLYAISITSCKKNDFVPGNKVDASAKVVAWLNKQKSTAINARANVNKDEKIELLKQNLAFENAKTEAFDKDYDFLIVQSRMRLKKRRILILIPHLF